MIKQKRLGKSFLSCILAVALLFSTLPTTVFADGVATNDDVGNLCEHHIEHDGTVCGYIAEVEGQECTHIHDETCYTEATVNSPATDSNVEEKVLSCSHVHDENCGHIEAVMGAPCVFKCEQCSPIDSGESVPGISNVMITSFDELGEAVNQQSVAAKTSLADLKLPDSLHVTGYTITNDTVVLDSGATAPAAIIIEGVAWKVDPAHELNMGTSSYDEQAEQGSYCFTPVLPEGYALAADVALPEIHVVVGGVNRLIDEPIVIRTAEDLLSMDLGQGVHTGTHYLLANDISLSKYQWTGIEIDFTKRPDDTILFDGNGHRITGLNLGSDESNGGLGLFGNVLSPGKIIIKNLEVQVESVSSGSTFLGAIVGDSSADITLINCKGYINQTNLPEKMAGAALVGNSRCNIILQQCFGNMGLVVRCDGDFYAEECGATGSTYNMGAMSEGGQLGMQAAGIIQTCIGNANLVNCFALYPGTSASINRYCESGGLIEYVGGNVSITNSYASYSPNFERQIAGGLIGCIDYKRCSISLNSTYYNRDIAIPVGGYLPTEIHAFGLRALYTPDDIYWSLPNPGKSQVEMKNYSTYEGWDFSNVWSISPSVNNGFPTLKALKLPSSEYPQFKPPINPPDPTTSITVASSAMTLRIDETKNLAVTTSPDGLPFTCVSSDPEIANVTNEGIVTAKKEGSTTITVSLVDTPVEKALCTVTVSPPEPYDDLMCAIAACEMSYERDMNRFLTRTISDISGSMVVGGELEWEGHNIYKRDLFNDVLGDWKIVGAQEDALAGFGALALESPDGTKRILVYRGTEKDLLDVGTDLRLVIGKLTAQFPQALDFYENYKGVGEVLITGHSLGGALAAHVSVHTGARAELFNGALGWSLDNSYGDDAESLFSNFLGVNLWNFTNHVTNSSGGTVLKDTLANRMVALHNFEKLPTRIYNVSSDALGSKNNSIHSLHSMLYYGEENKRFGLTSSNATAPTTPQEFFPILSESQAVFGTSASDKIYRASVSGIIKDINAHLFGGDGDDELTSSAGHDWLVSGSGSNVLDGGSWNDSYFLIPFDGTQIINDPSGFDTIYLPSGVRVTNQTQSGEYIITNLSNGQAVQVNAKRNFLAPAIKIRSMDGADCGKVEIKSRARRAAMQIPISTIEIDGNAVIKIVDESGNSVGTIDTTKDTFPRYENYGYFYFDDQTQHLSAILFNGAYQLEIINTESSIDYTILRHAEDDRPLTRAVAGGITLGIGNTLNTQTTFTGESTVPMTIKKSDGTESPVPYTVEDLTEVGDTSAVTGVLVTPKSVNVNKGATQKFIASVTGTGNYNNVVRWSVSGGAAGTQIDSSGKLTVVANETATLLTVTATSVQDSGKTDTAVITVTDKPNVSLYQLTISGSHAQDTGEGAYAEGAKVSVDAGTRDGYNFNGWTSVGGGTFTDNKSRNTIFTMPSNDVTIVANWVSAGGDSNAGNTSGGGGGGGNSNKSTITSTPDSAVLPAIGEIKVDGTVDKNGNTTVTVSDKAITDAINAAKKVARENSISISIHVNLQQTANRLTVSISKVSLDKLIAEGLRDLKISSSLVNMSFNLEALKEIQKSAVGNINISAKKQNIKTLSAAAQTTVGNRPVFDFSMQSGDMAITSFGKGAASIWMPYALAANEIAGNVQAVYVDDRGTVSPIIGSSYDVITKMMLFSTSHFSIYGVGYKQDAPKFIDISNHWAKDSIEFVAARGMLTGTGGNAFSPDSPITRGMFVTALGRLANADVSGNKTSSFTDVNAGTYYLSYIEWAVKNNIVQGMGNGTFAPDQAISREQMAVMTQNYAKAIGFNLPKVHAENTFADSAKIGGYAKNAVKAIQMAGILAGKNGNNFDPQGTATRAEVSALLQRFVELAISTGSAQGWMMNDSGKWMFYENGRPITGKKNIGGVSYVFDQNGEISDMPKNLTYGSYTVKSGDSFWKIAEVYKCNVYELARTNGKTIFSIIHPGEVLKILPQ